MAAAVLLPALFIGLSAERLFLSEAGGRQTVCGHSGRDECLLGRLSAAIAERHVVFGGSPLIAVALDEYPPVRMLVQELCVSLESRVILRPDLIAVIVKIGILDVLIE